MEHMDDLKRAYKTSLIINSGIIAGFVIYAVIIEFLKSRYNPFEGFVDLAQIAFLRYILYGLAILLIFIVRVLRGTLLRTSPSDDAKTLITKLSRASIATAALCEVPVVFGLVLFLIGGHSRDFYLLLGLSFIIVFLYFPRYRNWEEWLRIKKEI
ncbi:MAG: hypothetical protein JSV96_04765 [Candidatus Aminicenantes bacterium]|nr:MAG: hypothetical protein JSV96_04765 [Candidatus Aminicenantes bacterium]